MSSIISENELENISGGAYQGAVFKYKIQKGDCLSVLAERFGTTVGILCQINNIKNPDLIIEGKYLYIPVKQ